MVDRRVGATLAVAGLGVVTLGGYLAIQNGLGLLPDPESCTATAHGHSVALSVEQAENAALIGAVAERRQLPTRALTIALATAYQESDLENLDSGDRDSVGLFQQRPSQGWGRVAQLLDPYYATNAFYDALVEVDGYQQLEVTVAAQEVQRSGFPDAYADHALDGRTIAAALTGESRAALTCTVDEPEAAEQAERTNGLTADADAVRRDLQRAFGSQQLGGFAPGGVRDGHMPGSAHYEGRAVDVFFRPISPASRRSGWVVAHYLVANADRLGVDHVIFDDRIWSAGSRSEEGWREYDAPANQDPATQAILEHRDHVHVDVA